MKEYNKSSNCKLDLSKSAEFNANCRLNLLFLVSEILSSALQDTDEWLKKAGKTRRQKEFQDSYESYSCTESLFWTEQRRFE